MVKLYLEEYEPIIKLTGSNIESSSLVNQLITQTWAHIDALNSLQMAAESLNNQELMGALKEMVSNEYIHIGMAEKILQTMVPESANLDLPQQEDVMVIVANEPQPIVQPEVVVQQPVVQEPVQPEPVQETPVQEPQVQQPAPQVGLNSEGLNIDSEGKLPEAVEEDFVIRGVR